MAESDLILVRVCIGILLLILIVFGMATTYMGFRMMYELVTGKFL